MLPIDVLIAAAAWGDCTGSSTLALAVLVSGVLIGGAWLIWGGAEERPPASETPPPWFHA